MTISVRVVQPALNVPYCGLVCHAVGQIAYTAVYQPCSILPGKVLAL